MSHRVTRCAVLVGWALVLLFASWVLIQGGILPNVRSFQAAYLVGFAGYAILLWAIHRAPDAASLGRWRWWLMGCLAVRAMMVPAAPSDDAYRYVWEGRVQLAGYSPYRHPPDDPKLAPLRNADWSQINHPHFPAIYPPLAQMEFLVTAAVHPTVYAIKLIHVFWDALIVIVLSSCLRAEKQREHWTTVYALCPVVLSAFAIEGHLDSLMLLFAVGILWAVVTRRMHVAAMFLGLAIAAKTVAIVLLPWFIRDNWRSSLPAIAVAGLCYLPYGVGGLTGLWNLHRFGAGGAMFSVTDALGISWLETSGAKNVSGTCLFAVLLVLAWKRKTFISYAASASAALVLLLPIVHYWYLTWILLFQVFRRSMVWIIAVALMVVYFEGQHHLAMTGEWYLTRSNARMVWIPFFAVWIAVTLIAVYRRGDQ